MDGGRQTADSGTCPVNVPEPSRLSRCGFGMSRGPGGFLRCRTGNAPSHWRSGDESLHPQTRGKPSEAVRCDWPTGYAPARESTPPRRRPEIQSPEGGGADARGYSWRPRARSPGGSEWQADSRKRGLWNAFNSHNGDSLWRLLLQYGGKSAREKAFFLQNSELDDRTWVAEIRESGLTPRASRVSIRSGIHKCPVWSRNGR